MKEIIFCVGVSMLANLAFSQTKITGFHETKCHTLYAPGVYTGYGVKTMPGIREAIEQRN